MQEKSETCRAVWLLKELAEQTRPQHEAVEALVPLLRPGLAVADYRRYLEALYGLYGPLEEALAARLGDSLPELRLAERWKLPLLTADLHALGHEAASLARLPRASLLPELPDMPEALGCLYVLEGSTLGGQVLLRHLLRRFAGLPVEPFSFLRSYGESVGERWREFRRILERGCSQPALAPRVVRGARDTFQAFTDWLQEAGPWLGPR